jgi:tetratricopeptide (TPR) repeat protein
MNNPRYVFIVILVSQLLLGCAAIGVPSTDDPAKKLRWATELFDNHDRQIPAERLINEAQEIYKKENDDAGIAEVYRVYGLFLKSRAVRVSPNYFHEYGFSDKSVTYETRYSKAIEYFEKSRALYKQIGNGRHFANIELQIGLTYQFMNNTEAACSAFDRSLQEYQIMMKADINTKVVLPREYKNFKDGIADIKKSGGCKS